MRLKIEEEKMKIESHVVDERPMIERSIVVNSKRYSITVPIPKT